MTQTATQNALIQLEATRPLPFLATVALRVAVALAKYDHLRRSRRALLELDDHLLHDIGLDRPTAMAEAKRKFWQG